MLAIYLDTSVISALYDSRTPERQKQTQEMWQLLDDFEVNISEVVMMEIKGWPLLQEKSISLFAKFKILQITDESRKLAGEYVAHGVIPGKHYYDALHIAIASVNKMDFLISWNYKHLVKVKTRNMIKFINTQLNYSTIEIIAPPEL